MESRVSYAAVGAFVVVLSAALVGVGLWLGSGIHTKDYDHYAVYVDESVAGLNGDAPVKYRGVNVGRVQSINLDADNPQRVHLTLGIRKGTPIKTDTVATLSVQGLTGIAYLELSGGTPAAPRLTVRENRPYAVIKYKSSLLGRLDSAVSEGLKTLDSLGQRVDQLLSAENQKALTDSLSNLAKVSDSLARNTPHVEAAMANLDRTLADSAKAARDLPATLDRFNQVVDRFGAMTDTVSQAGADVSTLSDHGEQAVSQLSQTTLPQLNALIAELRETSAHLSQLTDQLSRNPDMLLYGRPRRAAGPGESK